MVLALSFLETWGVALVRGMMDASPYMHLSLPSIVSVTANLAPTFRHINGERLKPSQRNMTKSNSPLSQLLLYACLLLAATILGGCATKLQSEGPRRVEERRQFLKNYDIGQQMTVNVGDPVIKFQDFWLEVTESPVAIPTKTVNLKGGLIDITLVAGQKYPVRGKMSIEGVDYDVVAITDNPSPYQAVLVRADGTLHNRMVAKPPQWDGVVMIIYTMDISDPSARIVRETNQNVKTTKGYENFELLYTGTNLSGLNLTYREFSPDGLARVAFFQNLTYEAGAKSITFKKYRIAVDRASSEAITFTVVTDGH